MRRAAAIILALTLAAASARDIRTLDGTVYHEATVTRVEPRGIRIQHSTGVAFLDFAELPEDIRREFKYNEQAYATATAAHDKQLADASARRQAALIAAAKLLVESQTKRGAKKLSQAGQQVETSTPTPAPQPQWIRDKLVVAAALLDAGPYVARDYSVSRGYESSNRYMPSDPAQRTEHVSGYYTKKGTYVHSYKRSPPRY